MHCAWRLAPPLPTRSLDHFANTHPERFQLQRNRDRIGIPNHPTAINQRPGKAQGSRLVALDFPILGGEHKSGDPTRERWFSSGRPTAPGLCSSRRTAADREEWTTVGVVGLLLAEG